MSEELFPNLAPEDRPVRLRFVARLIVRCGDELLLEHTQDVTTGDQWWITPGGGLEPGESYADGAVRELFEETQYRLDPGELGAPVGHRFAVHGYSDRVTVQEEQFFLVDLPKFTPRLDGLTEEEQVTNLGFGWFNSVQLAKMRIYPEDLADFITAGPGFFRDWGTVDESIVPVSDTLLADSFTRLAELPKPD